MSKRTSILVLALIVVASAFLILPNLGDRLLWQDEAEVALLARSIATHGQPTAWDGRNVVTQQNGTEFGKDFVWHWSAWGTHYLAYLGTRIFGETPFGYRIHDAIFGILAVLAAYFAGLRWLKNEKLALFAAFLLLLSIPFLLFTRQCRYYSVTTFLGTMALWSYAGFPRRRPFAAFVIFASLAMYFNELSVGFLMVSLVAYSLIFDEVRTRWKLLFASWPIIGIMALPELFQRLKVGGNAKAWHDLNIGEYSIRILKGLFEWNNVAFPVIIVILLWVFRNKFEKNTRVLLALFTCMLVAGQFAVAPFLDPNICYSTYGFVVAAMLAASVISELWQKNKIATVILALVFYCTNLFSIGPIVWLGRWFKSENINYLSELTTHYQGPNEAVVDFLSQHAAPNDIVLTTYEQLTLMLHTNFRVAGVLDESHGQELSLPKYTYDPYDAGRFILRMNYCVDCPKIDADSFLAEMRQRGIRVSEYRIASGDLKYGNVANISYHEFTATKPREGEGIIAYKLER